MYSNFFHHRSSHPHTLLGCIFFQCRPNIHKQLGSSYNLYRPLHKKVHMTRQLRNNPRRQLTYIYLHTPHCHSTGSGRSTCYRSRSRPAGSSDHRHSNSSRCYSNCRDSRTRYSGRSRHHHSRFHRCYSKSRHSRTAYLGCSYTCNCSSAWDRCGNRGIGGRNGSSLSTGSRSCCRNTCTARTKGNPPKRIHSRHYTYNNQRQNKQNK